MTVTPSDPRIEVHEDAAELSTVVAGELLSRIADAQAAGHIPHIVLTGGSIAETIHQEVARLTPESGVDWGAVEIWFGDERFVAPDSPDRNVGQARAAFLDAVGVPAARVHEMGSTAEFERPSDAGRAYATVLDEHGLGMEGAHTFDVVMLGVGPDGHIASLFPGHPQLDIGNKAACGVVDSPKPPPERVTMTYPTLRRGRSVWFLVSGDGKADAVAKALGGADIHDTPAAGVQGQEETIWFLDRGAASRL